MTEQERMDAGKKVVARLGRLCEEKYDRTLDDDEKMSLQMALFYARDDEFNKGRVDILCPGNLNVKSLLDCDDFSLAHDVFQIDQYICKDSGQRTFGTMTRCFVPRCGFEKEVA